MSFDSNLVRLRVALASTRGIAPVLMQVAGLIVVWTLTTVLRWLLWLLWLLQVLTRSSV